MRRTQPSRLGRSVRRGREEPPGEVHDQVVQMPVGGDERPLTLGAVRGRESPHLIERAGAPEADRGLAAIGQEGVEHLPHRNQTARLRVDQPGVHPVSRRQEAVLGENLRTRHHR
jgi:hypothetical protein